MCRLQMSNEGTARMNTNNETLPLTKRSRGCPSRQGFSCADVDLRPAFKGSRVSTRRCRQKPGFPRHSTSASFYVYDNSVEVGSTRLQDRQKGRRPMPVAQWESGGLSAPGCRFRDPSGAFNAGGKLERLWCLRNRHSSSTIPPAPFKFKAGVRRVSRRVPLLIARPPEDRATLASFYQLREKK